MNVKEYLFILVALVFCGCAHMVNFENWGRQVDRTIMACESLEDEEDRSDCINRMHEGIEDLLWEICAEDKDLKLCDHLN